MSEEFNEPGVGEASPNHQPEYGGERPDDVTEVNTQRVQLGLHPLGGIQLLVVDASGGVASARIGPEEAWRLAGHLQTLTTMLIMQAYAQAAAVAEQNSIYIPGA